MEWAFSMCSMQIPPCVSVIDTLHRYHPSRPSFGRRRGASLRVRGVRPLQHFPAASPRSCRGARWRQADGKQGSQLGSTDPVVIFSTAAVW